jgi:hypothetical protein
MTGNVSLLPRDLNYLYLTGSNTVNGNIVNFPPSLINVTITGANTIGGIIGTMPTTISSIVIFGENTIGGPLSGVTNPNLTYFRFLGNTTIYGDLSDFNSHWGTLTGFGVAGLKDQAFIAPPANTTSVITGNLDTLPKIPIGPAGDGTKPFRNNMSLFQLVQGFNTVSGNINNFPVFVMLIIISKKESIFIQ